MNKNLKLFTFFTLIYYFSLGIYDETEQLQRELISEAIARVTNILNHTHLPFIQKAIAPFMLQSNDNRYFKNGAFLIFIMCHEDFWVMKERTLPLWDFFFRR